VKRVDVREFRDWTNRNPTTDEAIAIEWDGAPIG
jgi:hypothetical protein